MRRVLPFAILAGCLAIGVLPALAANGNVSIRDFAFTPSSVAVRPGESVTWAVESGYAGSMHNVHFDGEAAPLGAQSATFTATRQFDAEGEFSYRCDVHATMRGRVYVNQTGTVPTPSPTTSPTASPGASPTASPTTSPGAGGGGGASPGAPAGPGSTTAPVSSFRLRASRRGARIFLTLTIGAREPVRVRGTLRRGKRRVRSVTLLGRPGRHRVRLPGRALKPGRYTLTLRAGRLTRVVRFAVRAS